MNHNKILFILLIIACLSFNACENKDNKPVPEVKKDTIKTTHTKKQDNENELFSIAAVGDIMMGTNYPSSSSLPPDDGEFILAGVEEYLRDADLTFGNLEGTLLNKGGTPKKCLNPENCVAFRMPEHYASYLKKAGFDVMSTANNHSGDMGPEGRESTGKVLERYDLNYAGYLTKPTAIFEINGVKYGFTAFAPNTGTMFLNDHKKAAEVVAGLKKICDVVIVSFHGGGEGTGAMHVPGRREIFLEEDRGNVYEFAHTVIDAGADIVLGHGPHVVRGMELYKGRIIAYSLGNFCTYKKFGLSGALGVAPILKIFINKKGEFKKGELISIKQINSGVPVLDEKNAAAKYIENLTKEDFDGGGLTFTDNIIGIKK